MNRYLQYLDKLTKPYETACKITLLNPDETEKGEITNELYSISGAVTVNYQNGARRSCSLTIDNDKNKNPIDINHFWFGQKFKLWLGLYLDDTTPFYFPQGVFCVSSPTSIYKPSERTITIDGIDKWAMLNGVLHGTLSGTYQTNIGNNLFDAIRQLLKLSRYDELPTADLTMMVDPKEPILDNSYIGKLDSFHNEVLLCPYTSTINRGGTYADVLLEYAKILSANIYYDADGRLTLEELLSLDDFDSDKEILWHYTIYEKELTGVETTYNFDKVYNDFIVLGNIANGYQAKARVQNHNPLSDISVEEIGLKTKPPYEDSQYYSDDQCLALAKEYAKQEGMLKKSRQIPSAPMYHFDVDKLITLATPENGMTRELHVIKGYTLPLGTGMMSLDVCSVNNISNFDVIEVDMHD